MALAAQQLVQACLLGWRAQVCWVQEPAVRWGPGLPEAAKVCHLSVCTADAGAGVTPQQVRLFRWLLGSVLPGAVGCMACHDLQDLWQALCSADRGHESHP